MLLLLLLSITREIDILGFLAAPRPDPARGVWPRGFGSAALQGEGGGQRPGCSRGGWKAPVPPDALGAPAVVETGVQGCGSPGPACQSSASQRFLLPAEGGGGTDPETKRNKSRSFLAGEVEGEM